MERDCLIAHSVLHIMREMMLVLSDNYSVMVCQKCGSYANKHPKIDIYYCKKCGNRTKDIYDVRMPYAFKLLTHELMGMKVEPKLIVGPGFNKKLNLIIFNFIYSFIWLFWISDMEMKIISTY